MEEYAINLKAIIQTAKILSEIAGIITGFQYPSTHDNISQFIHDSSYSSLML